MKAHHSFQILALTVLTLALALLPQVLQAQWRVGVNAGATYNLYSIDKQYMTDYRFIGAWGVTMGVTSQYNFMDWLGVRAGLQVSQRNYRHTRAVEADRLNCLYRNDYLMLPVTANFSFGGASLRGFLDLGVYGGYWLSSYRSGKEYVSLSNFSYDFSEPVHFNAEKDQRWDFGYAGGLGMEWKFSRHWVVQAEALCRYGVVSTVKQYMKHVKDYRYNTTLGLQAGVSYIF